jgi:MarR family transcriptional regulator, organic hydroperoxide resistance regulator
MSTEHLAEELLTFTRMLRPLRHSNMTPQQYWLLRQLSNEGPLRISELAQALGVTTGTATVACQRLEKSGLLTRERQIDDERVVLVVLTKQGQALIEETLQKRRDVLNQLLQVLTKDEQTKLQQIIERLLHAAEAQGM